MSCSRTDNRFGSIFVTFVIASTFFQVDEERLKRQFIGLGVPESWFSDIDDESKDFLPINGFKPWLCSDLTNPPDEPNHVPGYAQVAIASIMMGTKTQWRPYRTPTDDNSCLVEHSRNRVYCSLERPFLVMRSSGMCTSTTLQSSPCRKLQPNFCRG